MQKATVAAHANIALIKYWGKRDESLFLPTKSSLSVTLDGLTTTTTVTRSTRTTDDILLNGSPASAAVFAQVTAFLDVFRSWFGQNERFSISTENNFPTAAGLASSSSGFAALAYGLSLLCNLNLSPEELSRLARRGSGSASRSIFGGFVLWHMGSAPDGQDSYAEEIFPAEHWEDFRVLVTILSAETKKTSSRAGMQQSISSSPTYGAYLAASAERIPQMQAALAQRDIERVGQLAEADCLEMHRTMQDSTPPLNYWQPATEILMDAVRSLRDKGCPCFFTIDAGPNVKVICLAQDEERIVAQLNSLAEVQSVISCRIGQGVRMIASS